MLYVLYSHLQPIYVYGNSYQCKYNVWHVIHILIVTVVSDGSTCQHTKAQVDMTTVGEHYTMNDITFPAGVFL